MPTFVNTVYCRNILASATTTKYKVTIAAIGGEIIVNSTILKKLSPYFSSHLRHKYTKNKDSVMRVCLAIDISSLTSIVIYAYTGKVYIDSHNVVKLLRTAIATSVEFIIHTCINFIIRDFKKEYCLECYSMGIEYGISNLLYYTKEFIAIHFLEMENDIIDNFDCISIKLILESDDLNVPDEDYVVNFIIRWYMKRKNNLGNLLLLIKNIIRFNYLSPSGMDNIRWILDDDKVCESYKRPRISYMYPFMKDYDIKNMDCIIEAFDICTSTHIGKLVYLIGGWINNEIHNKVIAIDYLSNKWIPVPPMNSPRLYASGVSCNNKLYVLGGLPNPSSVECWSHGTAGWINMPSLLKPRCSPATTTLNNVIYVIGGHSETDTTTEYLLPDHHRWHFGPLTHYPHHKSCAITFNKKLFVVGRHTEIYNSVCNVWNIAGNPIYPRDHPELIIIGNKLLLMGGFYNGEYVGHVEIFNPRNDSWNIWNGKL
ncbi:kelch-like protein [Volepox virus]|uniref:Kelch-like protein n=1 Tax=Volepox virus TaxID=28874 RepID=A0A1C9KC57_9POXV|nr:kelch-like protein [Volepox virus]AOP31729.1 kelch-like protein [Volepox virus]